MLLFGAMSTFAHAGILKPVFAVMILEAMSPPETRLKNEIHSLMHSYL